MSGSPVDRLSGWARALVLLIAPLVLVGPALLPGQRFLPQAPVQYEPLRSEHPEAAAAADRGSNRYTGDRVFPALSDQVELRRRLASGEDWTWEEKWGLGAPLLGNTIAGPYYPPNLLALLLPPDRAAAPLAIGSLFLAGLGAWLFLARRGLGEAACALAAVAYQGTGWGVVNLHYGMKVDAALWLPWCLLALDGWRRGDRRGLPLLVLCSAASLSAGFPPVAGFALAAVLVVALGSALGDALSGARAAAVLARVAAPVAAVLCGALLAGAQLVPTAAAALDSHRGHPTPEGVAAQALPLGTLLVAGVPDPFGDPRRDPPRYLPLAFALATRAEAEAAQGANALEWNTHAGAATFALALVGALLARRRALAPLALLALALAWAQDWPGARVLYHLPMLNGGAPSRALSVAWFAWVWLAALGVDRVLRGGTGARTVAAVAASALALAAVAARALLPSEERLAEALARRHGLELPAVREVLPPAETAHALEHLAGGLALAGAVFALVAAFAWVRRSARGGAAALATVPLWTALLLEVLVVSRGHLLPRDLGGLPVFPPSAALDAVARAAGEGRVLRYAPHGLEELTRLARPNMLQVHGVKDLSAYVAFNPVATAEWFEAIDPRMRSGGGVARLPATHLLDDDRLDRAGVTCVLSGEPIEHERLALEYDGPGLYVYRRRNPLPPEEWLTEPPGSGSARAWAARARRLGGLASLVGAILWVLVVHRLARRGARGTA